MISINQTKASFFTKRRKKDTILIAAALNSQPDYILVALV